LAGKIEFPKTKVLGYHASSLRVTREKKKVICGNKHRTTTWGCTHTGYAEVGNWKGDEGCNEIETATIEDAEDGVYEFTMQHVFDSWELYYQGEDTDNDGDDDIVGILTISVNGVDIGAYNYPINKDMDTHNSDGSINGEFRDMVFVDVTCDDTCNCIPAKRRPICPIRAEVRHPSVSDMEEDGHIGYHNDAISVTKRTQESCSSSSPLTKWCVHEGDAMFFYDTDDEFDDVSTTESIVIPEAANDTFSFYIHHDIPPKEKYYEGGIELVGEVHLFINYKKIGTYTHWLGEDEDAVFSESFFLNVECDDACNCSVNQQKEGRKILRGSHRTSLRSPAFH